MTFGGFRDHDISMVPRSRLEWYQERLEDNDFHFLGKKQREDFEEAIVVELEQRDRSYSDF